MFFYSGVSIVDRYVGVLIGICTLGVVFFPTSLIAPLDIIGIIHNLFALILFLLLAAISCILFPRKLPGVDKDWTDRLQMICGLIMFLCVMSTIGYYYSNDFDIPQGYFVFLTESIALIAFGVSWFTEGLDLEKEVFNPA